MYYFVYDTIIGKITIAENGKDITHIAFGNIQFGENCETKLISQAKKQLFEYFEKKRTIFELPLSPKGTDFQKSVWQALLQVPFGETVSYGDIAVSIGKPAACRAVGAACGKNPIAIAIPCHRIVGKNGALTGFAGGLPVKEKLLLIEKE